ncbi:hypothetical protein HMPREF2738_01477 [Clostridiales bacterium KLE1615]|nr:hypothetical protein HMPREF2738_01477 [Clostridiales bacterium KLE1615]
MGGFFASLQILFWKLLPQHIYTTTTATVLSRVNPFQTIYFKCYSSCVRR